MGAVANCGSAIISCWTKHGTRAAVPEQIGTSGSRPNASEKVHLPAAKDIPHVDLQLINFHRP